MPPDPAPSGPGDPPPDDRPDDRSHEPPGPVRRGATLALLVVLGAVVAVLGAALLPYRVGGVRVPVAVVVAVAGNLSVARAAVATGAGRLGAVLPAGAWLLVTAAVAGRGPGGDTVVTGDLTGTYLAYLVLGAAAAVVGIARAAVDPPRG